MSPETRFAQAVDLNIAGDGIDDESHAPEWFLKTVGTGDDRYPEPARGARSWPELPDHVKGITESFYRKPDFVATSELASRGNDSFTKLMVERAKECGWIFKRNPLEKAGRWIAGALVSATVIGGFWCYSRYRMIKPGRIGFCVDLDQNIRMLLPGHHCEFNPTHTPIVEYSVDDDNINFLNRAHIIRVHPGEICLSKLNDQYQILLPGEKHSVGVHMFSDPRFEFIARVPQTHRAVLGGPINILTVEPGCVACIKIENRPYVLFEGKHEILSGLVEFRPNEQQQQRRQPDDLEVGTGFQRASDTFRFGTITHIYIPPGAIRFVRVRHHATFLDKAGDYWFFSDQIFVSKEYLPTERCIMNSPLTRIMCNDTEVGLIQQGDGQLKVLHNGTHVIQIPNIFLGTIPLSVQYREIKDIKGVTSDPMDVLFDFTVAFGVVDPIRAFLAGTPNGQGASGVSFDTVCRAVISTAQRTMSEIIRKLVYRATFKLSTPTEDESAPSGAGALASGAAAAANDQPGALAEQWRSVSSESVKKLTKTLLEVYGCKLHVTEFAIARLDLADQKQQDKLSKAAFKSAEIQEQLLEVEHQRRVAEIDQAKKKIEADTKVAENLIVARSKREIAELEAAAEVARIRALADAEAEKITRIASAEKKAKEDFSEGVELRRLQIMADALKGTTLTVYDTQQGGLGRILQEVSRTMLSSRAVAGGDHVDV